jgi:hypothetical protein
MTPRKRPYMMAHPTWRTRDYRLAVAFTMAVVTLIALAGASR